MQGVATRYDSLGAVEAAEATEALQRSETSGTGEAVALARMRARQAAAKAAREAANGVGAPPLPAVPELRPEVSSERLAPPSPSRSQPHASLSVLGTFEPIKMIETNDEAPAKAEAAPAAATLEEPAPEEGGGEGKIHRVYPEFGSILTVSNKDSQ